jgi:cytochrome P450 family 144
MKNRSFPGELLPQMLLAPEVIADPTTFYRRLREEAPVWRVPGTDVVTVASFAAVSEAVRRVEDFSSNIEALLYRDDRGLPARVEFGGAGVQTLATADPPVHTSHRAAVFPELVARRMTALEPDVEELSVALTRRALEPDEPFDFMAMIGNQVPIRVIGWLIGFEDSDPAALLQAAFDSTEMLAATMARPELESLLFRTDEVSAWLAGEVQSALRSPGEGILGAIARSIQSGAIQLEEGVVIIHTLLSAGGESTTSLLGNAVRILAEQPELQQRLRADRSLIEPFTEEVLRLESPFRNHMRSAHATTELAGVEISEGATMLLLWGAANRDPVEFDRPDEVVLDRSAPRHHVAFGRGIHHCVGAPLARLEARVVLSTLLEQTDSFELASDSPPAWVNSLMVRRHTVLPIRCHTG